MQTNTQVRNVTGSPVAMPNPYTGMLPPGASAVVPGAPADFIKAAGGTAYVKSVFDIGPSAMDATPGFRIIGRDLWEEAADPAGGRAWGAVAQLPSGRILVIGGATRANDFIWGQGQGVGIYDPNSGAWMAGAPLPGKGPLLVGGQAFTLADGRVVYTGGVTENEGGTGVGSDKTSATFVYTEDLGAGSWEQSGSLPVKAFVNFGGRPVFLPDANKYMVAGGQSDDGAHGESLFGPSGSAASLAVSPTAGRLRISGLTDRTADDVGKQIIVKRVVAYPAGGFPPFLPGGSAADLIDLEAPIAAVINATTVDVENSPAMNQLGIDLVALTNPPGNGSLWWNLDMAYINDAKNHASIVDGTAYIRVTGLIDLTRCSPLEGAGLVGQRFTISGSASYDGDYEIHAVINDTTIDLVGTYVADDANNGAVSWAVLASSYATKLSMLYDPLAATTVPGAVKSGGHSGAAASIGTNTYATAGRVTLTGLTGLVAGATPTGSVGNWLKISGAKGARKSGIDLGNNGYFRIVEYVSATSCVIESAAPFSDVYSVAIPDPANGAISWEEHLGVAVTGKWDFTRDLTAELAAGIRAVTLTNDRRMILYPVQLPGDGVYLPVGSVTGFVIFESDEKNHRGEVYSAVTGKWTATASLPDDWKTEAPLTATLPGGLVLIAGGGGVNSVGNKTIIYDPIADTYRRVADLPLKTDVKFPLDFALSDGTILITGGLSTYFQKVPGHAPQNAFHFDNLWNPHYLWSYGAPLYTSFMFNPATERWYKAADLPKAFPWYAGDDVALMTFYGNTIHFPPGYREAKVYFDAMNNMGITLTDGRLFWLGNASDNVVPQFKVSNRAFIYEPGGTLSPGPTPQENTQGTALSSGQRTQMLAFKKAQRALAAHLGRPPVLI